MQPQPNARVHVTHLLFRGNEKPHVNQFLRHATMRRSKRKSKSNKTEIPLRILNYKKELNQMTKPNKSAKLEYFNNLKPDKDNDLFLEKCNPYFTNKYIKMVKQILIL